MHVYGVHTHTTAAGASKIQGGVRRGQVGVSGVLQGTRGVRQSQAGSGGVTQAGSGGMRTGGEG